MEIEVLYTNVLIENPFYKTKEKGAIHLDSVLEKKMQEEQILAEMEKTKKLKVFKAGSACVKVKDQDDVFVETSRLMGSPRIALKDKDYFIVRESDVVFIYKSGSSIIA